MRAAEIIKTLFFNIMIHTKNRKITGLKLGVKEGNERVTYLFVFFLDEGMLVCVICLLFCLGVILKNQCFIVG